MNIQVACLKPSKNFGQIGCTPIVSKTAGADWLNPGV